MVLWKVSWSNSVLLNFSEVLGGSTPENIFDLKVRAPNSEVVALGMVMVLIGNSLERAFSLGGLKTSPLLSPTYFLGKRAAVSMDFDLVLKSSFSESLMKRGDCFFVFSIHSPDC